MEKNIIIEKNIPQFVYRDGMITDKEYVEWLSDLKQRFQRSQAKAAVRVNTAMLEYYWSLGRDIIQKQAESKWGSGFFNQLSHDMRTMFPNETGFSSANLRYMKRWYQCYYEQVVIWKHHAVIFTNCKPLGVSTCQLQKVGDRNVAELELRKRQQKG